MELVFELLSRKIHEIMGNGRREMKTELLLNRKKNIGEDLMKMYATQSGHSLSSNATIHSAISGLPHNSMAAIPNALPQNLSGEIADLLRQKKR